MGEMFLEMGCVILSGGIFGSAVVMSCAVPCRESVSVDGCSPVTAELEAVRRCFSIFFAKGSTVGWNIFRSAAFGLYPGRVIVGRYVFE